MRSRTEHPLLEVRLFGGPLLRRPTDGEQAIHLSAYQSGLLAAVFGAGPRGATRVDLTRLLWSEGDERTRRRRLSQLLYALNRKAPPGPIVAEKDLLRPDLQVATSDLSSFREALAEERLREAAEIMSRGFLDGLQKDVTDDFGDWRTGKRLRLRRELRERASGVWSGARSDADWTRAAEAADVLLGIDPLDEEALRRVILARGMREEIAEAQAAARSFEERFRLEGGDWTPSRETRELLDRLDTIAEAETPRHAPPASEPSFCGRGEELATLSRLVSADDREGLALVTVRGEGGMGKTRLVEEALKGTRFQRIRVLSGSSSEFERDIPLNPILEALSRPDVGEVLRDLEDPWRIVLLALMPELHEGPGPLPEIPHVRPGSLPRRLFEAVRQIFLAVAEEGPVVLFLDDFHWADETSIAALEYLRRRWEGKSLCIVLALRPEDMEREGAAARFIGSLEPLDVATDIELGDLPESEVRALISEVAGDELSSRQTDRIAALSGNNPFFVIELTMDALAGREIPGEEIRQLTPIPVSIRQLLEHRLAGLSAQAKQILGLLVTFGREIADGELRRLGGLDGESLVDALEQLQKMRLVERTGDGGVAVRHELIRQTVYGGLSEARRSFVHDKVARFLLEHREPPPVDELALHFDRAGVSEEACRFALQAAKMAENSGAIPEALRFLGIARQNTDDQAESTDILWRLAHLHYLHRNLSEAAPLLELAARRLRGQGRVVDALEAEAEKLDTLASLGALPEDDVLAEIGLLKRDAIDAGNWSIVANLLDTAIHIHYRSDNVKAVKLCLRELESFLDCGDEEGECLMLSSLMPHVFYGDPEKGVMFSRQAVAIAEKLGRRELWLKAVTRYLGATTVRGIFNTENCIELIRKAQEEAKLTGDLISRCLLHSNLGVWNIDVGYYDRALTELHAALETLKTAEAPHLKTTLFYNLGEAYYFLTDIEKSLSFFSRAKTALSPASPQHYSTLIQAGIGLCELHRGHLNNASRIEQEISISDSGWTYDITLYVIFKQKILIRMGRREDAIDLLEKYSVALAYRFPTQTLRLKLELAKLQLSVAANKKKVTAILNEVLDAATQKRIKRLADEARELLPAS